MTPGVWVIFYSTHHWALKIMLVAALAAAISIIYAAIIYGKRIFRNRPPEFDSSEQKTPIFDCSAT